MKKILLTLMAPIWILSSHLLNAQNKDKAIFREYKPGFYENSILRDDRELNDEIKPQKNVKRLSVDLQGTALPNKTELYKNKQWHNPPVSQGATNTCWCFSTTSFLESEVYRINRMQVRLSEMYTVYWEYVEKTKRFVRERGNSAVAEGSEANAVTRMWKKYGIVPLEAYTGMQEGRKFHNHVEMFNEIKSYLNSLREASEWNEDAAVETVKSILNHYMGSPPAEIIANGRKLTPLQYLNEILRINPDDYVDIVSYSQEPYYKQVEYIVPDNWWHSNIYYNIPLNEFMVSLKNAVRNGYTVSIAGDVSEPGLDRISQCAIVPDFDIPSEYINDDARQFRFSNQTTTDDHGMHLVGYLEKEGKDWYLIKDSSSGSRNNDKEAKEFGYYFFSDDYVRLKMMNFMIHKDGVKNLLSRF